MTTSFIIYGLTASFGSLLQELMYWYTMRAKLELKKYQTLMNSAGYKLVTLAMIVLTGPAVVIWYYGDSVTLRDYLLTGAAFPLIFKKAAETFRLGHRQLGSEGQGSLIDSYLSQL